MISGVDFGKSQTDMKVVPKHKLFLLRFITHQSIKNQYPEAITSEEITNPLLSCCVPDEELM